MNIVLNFLRSGTTESSKRLLTILSYIVSLGIAIFCAVAGATLEGNVLILLLGLSGIATTQQILGNKNEVTKVEDRGAD
jgi:hypothetical protein